MPPHPFPACTVTAVPVSRLSWVTYDRNRYSVPCAYVGQGVQLHAYWDRVEIFASDTVIATHPRAEGRGHTVLTLAHYLPVLRQKPYAVTHAAVVRDLPEPWPTVRQQLLADPQGYRELAELLLLHRAYPATVLAEAVAAVLATAHPVTVAAVRLHLQPRRAVSALAPVPEALRRIPVAVGDPGQYDCLLEEGI